MTTTHKPNYNPLKNETDIYGLPLSSAVDKLEGKSKKSLCEKIQTTYDLPNWTCDRIPRENKYVIKTFPLEPGTCEPSEMVINAIAKNYIIDGECKSIIPNNKNLANFCKKFNNNDCNKAKYNNNNIKNPCNFSPKNKTKATPSNSDIKKNLTRYCMQENNEENCNSDKLCTWIKDNTEEKEIEESDIYKKLKKQFDYLKNKDGKLKNIIKTIRSNTIDTIQNTTQNAIRPAGLLLILKVITMVFAGYLAWKCGYKNMTYVRVINTFLSCIFSEFYLVYYYFNGKQNNKIC